MLSPIVIVSTLLVAVPAEPPTMTQAEIAAFLGRPLTSYEQWVTGPEHAQQVAAEARQRATAYYYWGTYKYKPTLDGRVQGGGRDLTSLVCPDHERLRDQTRQRQRVIDAELRVLQQQARDAEFGSQLYWQLRRNIRALERERSSLRSLESALSWGREQEIGRRQADYRRAQQETLRLGQSLVEMRARELPFGSRTWYDHRRMARSWQQQRRASEPFGPEYRRALEAQIRLLESQYSQLDFGSSQWYAVKRQMTALRQALRSAR